MMSKDDVNGNWRTIRGRKVFVKDANGESAISAHEFNEHHAGYQPNGSEHRAEGMKQAAKERLNLYAQNNIQAPVGTDASAYKQELLGQFMKDRFGYEPASLRTSVMNEVLQETSPNDGLAQQAYETLKTNGHYDPRFEDAGNLIASVNNQLPTVRYNPDNPIQYNKSVDTVFNKLKEVKQNPNLTDVQRYEAVLIEAEKQAGGDRHKFMALTADVFFPSNHDNLAIDGMIHNRYGHVHDKIQLGSKGLGAAFSDGTSMQISHHFHGLLEAGFNWPKQIADGSNFIHEKLEPLVNKNSGGSKEDFDLSVQAIRLGKHFRDSEMSMKEFRSRANRILNGEKVYASKQKF
jgi:hypothetical protein